MKNPVKSMATNQSQPVSPIMAAAVSPTPAVAYEEAAPVLTLDKRGMIRDCNRAGEAFFGYHRREMFWHHVSMLMPELATLDLIVDEQPNPRLRFLSRVGRHFETVARDGTRSTVEVFLNLLDGRGAGRLSLILRPAINAAGMSAR